MDSVKIVTVNLEAKPEKTVDKVESFDEYDSGVSFQARSPR
ncbi:hypothetical protein PMM76_01090 [Bifidobacterium pseudocatenulatum]|nr:hypothetical protein [Bifidobacterium pseudocatenulatum]MDB6511710.1 hypothetical protein [Bifidobacterium pseudocatenulatum]MDB6514351.1 hypothetical protein [Bifidobacterium pseudocatenulatum]